jgi:hypothetical protein
LSEVAISVVGCAILISKNLSGDLVLKNGDFNQILFAQ